MGNETPTKVSKPAIPPTYRKMMEQVIVELSLFKTILTKEDNIIFDKIMDYTRKIALQEEREAFFPGDFDAKNFLILSIFIEQQKEIEKLNGTIKKLIK